MLSCVRGNENESSRSGVVFLTFSMSSNPRAGARVVLLRAGAGGMGKDMGQGGDRPSFDRERPRLTLHPPDVPTHLQNTFSHVLLFYFLVKEILPPFILPSQTILGLCSAPNLHWTGINWFYPSCVNTWDAVLPSSPCSACWACNRQIQAKFHFIFFLFFRMKDAICATSSCLCLLHSAGWSLLWLPTQSLSSWWTSGFGFWFSFFSQAWLT